MKNYYFFYSLILPVLFFTLHFLDTNTLLQMNDLILMILFSFFFGSMLIGKLFDNYQLFRKTLLNSIFLGPCLIQVVGLIFSFFIFLGINFLMGMNLLSNERRDSFGTLGSFYILFLSVNLVLGIFFGAIYNFIFFKEEET